MMMIMESRTPFIVRLGHDIACVQMNRLESETFLQTITGGTDFNIQGRAIWWAGRSVSLDIQTHGDLLTALT
jgi:hypothetical protein